MFLKMDLTKRERIGLGLFGLILLLTISIMYFKGQPDQAVEVIEDKAAVTSTSNRQQVQSAVDCKNPEKLQSGAVALNKTIKVCVLGEVKQPGVYALSEGDRIEQAVNMAGGFTSKAQTDNINLAMKLKDEDMIRIPGIHEKPTGQQPAIVTGTGMNSDVGVVSASTEAQEGLKININTASKEQLKELPRIGDAIAQRILDYRQQQGNFKKIENIMNVSGIGEKMFENLKDKITIE